MALNGAAWLSVTEIPSAAFFNPNQIVDSAQSTTAAVQCYLSDAALIRAYAYWTVANSCRKFLVCLRSFHRRARILTAVDPTTLEIASGNFEEDFEAESQVASVQSRQVWMSVARPHSPHSTVGFL